METKAKLTLSDVLLITVYWVTFFTALFFIL
jgi:hypothetical protein